MNTFLINKGCSATSLASSCFAHQNAECCRCSKLTLRAFETSCLLWGSCLKKNLKMNCRGFLVIETTKSFLAWCEQRSFFWTKYELPWIEKRDQWRFPTKKAGSLFSRSFFFGGCSHDRCFCKRVFFFTAEEVAEFPAAFWAGAGCRHGGWPGLQRGFRARASVIWKPNQTQKRPQREANQACFFF